MSYLRKESLGSRLPDTDLGPRLPLTVVASVSPRDKITAVCMIKKERKGADVHRGDDLIIIVSGALNSAFFSR